MIRIEEEELEKVLVDDKINFISFFLIFLIIDSFF